MNLLIIAQKIDENDANLGFFPNWIFNFSKKTTKVFVIANFVGKYNLPTNVEVFSLGKERGHGKIKRYYKAIRLIGRLSKKSDGIFIHMCSEYTILAWLFSVDKKIFMWFVHELKNWKLWLAEKLVDKIFTVAKNSCRIKSKKIKIVGHGIDIDIFRKKRKINNNNNNFKILTVGRISSIKDHKTLLMALCYLINIKKIKNIKLTIVGDTYLKEDIKYKEEIINFIEIKGLNKNIELVGDKNRNEIIDMYSSYDLFTSQSGGMDKVILEASSCKLPVLTATESFEKFTEGYDLTFGHKNPKDLMINILKMINKEEEERAKIGNSLRSMIEREHSLSNLVDKIIKEFK